MKTQDELFMLIKSMDKNEKGYFRKFSKLHGSRREGNYLKLFDCISSMDEYSDAKIREQFKAEKFAKRLSSTKHYLKNLIMKSLRNYYDDTDPEIELLNGLTEVSILLKRQLYESASRSINKLKQLAHTQNAFLHSLFLLRAEQNNLWLKGSLQELISTSKERLDKARDYLTLYENICAYNNLQDLINGTIQRDGAASDGNLTVFKSYLNLPLLRDENMALSFYAKASRYKLLSVCYHKIGNAQKSYEIAIELVELYRSNPAQIRLNPHRYAIALSQLVFGCNMVQKYQDALKYVEDIDALASDKSMPLGENTRFEIYCDLNQMKLTLLCETEQFEKLAAVEKRLARIMKGKPARPSLLISIAFMGAWGRLGLGQPDEALHLNNKIINGEYAGARKDFILTSLGMNVLIHYDLGNYDLIKRLIKMQLNYMNEIKVAKDGWDIYQKCFTEIVKAAKAGKEMELKLLFKKLLLSMPNNSFVSNELTTWWLKNKLKE